MTKYLHQILFSVLSSSSAKAAKREKKISFLERSRFYTVTSSLISTIQMYFQETVALTKRQEPGPEILRFSLRVSKMDNIGNECIRHKFRLSGLETKMVWTRVEKG